MLLLMAKATERKKERRMPNTPRKKVGAKQKVSSRENAAGQACKENEKRSEKKDKAFERFEVSRHEHGRVVKKRKKKRDSPGRS